MADLEDLKKQIREFVKEREWGKYHSPKNLAMGLNVEASELLEIFLWLSEEASKELSEKQLAQLKDEIGDVMIYLANLSDKFGLDPIACGIEKLKANRRKYPPELVRGSAKKYSEY